MKPVLSDIEIAQQAELKPITELPNKWDLRQHDLELYGK